MGFKDIGKWLRIAGQFAPQILLLTPLAPIAGQVSVAIQEAEKIPGASGQEKLDHVVKIAQQAASANNAVDTNVQIDPAMIPTATADAVKTVVDTVNGIHKVSGAK